MKAFEKITEEEINSVHAKIEYKLREFIDKNKFPDRLIINERILACMNESQKRKTGTSWDMSEPMTWAGIKIIIEEGFEKKDPQFIKLAEGVNHW